VCYDRWITGLVGIIVFGLSACSSITVPVAVTGDALPGGILRGTATASLAGGSFNVSNGALSCGGTYDALDTSTTITMPVHCNDGRNGTVVSTRTSYTSGYGNFILADGTDGRFVFGSAASTVRPESIPQSVTAGLAPTSLQPAQPRSPTHGPEEIHLEKRNNAYYVPVRINNAVTIPFVLDTGASDLAIPADVALTLVRAGALNRSDVLGKNVYQIANGSQEISPVIRLNEVTVGDHTISNVTAGITQATGEPLLGQSFLSKFGTVTVDYKRLVLTLSP
jgi:clan AA aspartic protease (TIGR02281 family)